jgi:hypothetical protein
MGMDVYGLNPQTDGNKPERPEDWHSLTDYEKGRYHDAMYLWESNNPGVYFRANCWSWRPIHAIADMAIRLMNLPFDTGGWAFNDGSGLDTQEECDQLADAIEAFMTLNHAEMHDDEDRFYLCLGSWTNSSGTFIDKEIQDELNAQHLLGTILYRGVVASNGQLVFPSHSAPLYHVNNFVTFLRKCGGFEIW